MKRLVVFMLAALAVTAAVAQDPYKPAWYDFYGRAQRAQMGEEAYQRLKERQAKSAARRQANLEAAKTWVSENVTEPVKRTVRRVKVAHQGGEEEYARTQAQQAELKKKYPRGTYGPDIYDRAYAGARERAGQVAQYAREARDYTVERAQQVRGKLGETFKQQPAGKSYFARQARQQEYDEAYASESRVKSAAQYRKLKAQDMQAYGKLEQPYQPIEKSIARSPHAYETQAYEMFKSSDVDVVGPRDWSGYYRYRKTQPFPSYRTAAPDSPRALEYTKAYTMPQVQQPSYWERFKNFISPYTPSTESVKSAPGKVYDRFSRNKQEAQRLDSAKEAAARARARSEREYEALEQLR